MVGDRCYDINGARANGMAAFGVLYGYGTQDEIIDAGAAGLIQEPSEFAHSLIMFMDRD